MANGSTLNAPGGTTTVLHCASARSIAAVLVWASAVLLPHFAPKSVILQPVGSDFEALSGVNIPKVVATKDHFAMEFQARTRPNCFLLTKAHQEADCITPEWDP